MWQRFTERARRAILLGQEEAGRANSAYVATEHLLLGLLLEGESLGAKALHTMGVTLDQVREELGVNAAMGTTLSTTDFKLTEKAKRVLEIAAVEANRMQHKYIGTEHMLLALLYKEGRFLEFLAQWPRRLDLPVPAAKPDSHDVALQVLTRLRIDHDTALAVIRDLLGETVENPLQNSLTAEAFEGIRVAQELTWSTGCGQIHPAHILWGLLHTEHILLYLAAFAIKDVDLPTLREEVRRRITSDGKVGTNQMQFSESSRRVFKRAKRIAYRNKQFTIDIDSLLMALFREKDDLALEPLLALKPKIKTSDPMRKTVQKYVASLNVATKLTAEANLNTDLSLNLCCFFSTAICWTGYLAYRYHLSPPNGASWYEWMLLILMPVPFCLCLVSCGCLLFSKSQRWKNAAWVQITGLFVTLLVLVILNSLHIL